MNTTATATTVTTFQSGASSHSARTHAERVHALLLRVTPDAVTSRLLENLDSKDKALAIYGPFPEHFGDMMDNIREAVCFQYDEAVRAVLIAALLPRGYDPTKVAPVDFPAMLAALRSVPTETDYDRAITRIKRLVDELNKVLGYEVSEDYSGYSKDGVTFGYIGNLWTGATDGSKGDDRSFMVFLPHPNRVGTDADRLGGFSYGDLDGTRSTLAQLAGALRLTKWQKGLANGGW